MKSARIEGVIASIPDGRIIDVYEIYIGMRGQLRVGLVDHIGRVYHYDADQLRINSATKHRFEQILDLS